MKATSHSADRKTRKNGWLTIVVFVAVLAGGIAVFLYGWRTVSNPLAHVQTDALKWVTIQSLSPGTDEFPVNRQRWKNLLENFRSSNVDWNPSGWQGLAEIRFQFNDGNDLTVWVFDTGRNTGAFRIGKVCYSGGDEQFLLRLINDETKRQDR